MSPRDGSEAIDRPVLPAPELAEATPATQSAKTTETDTPQVKLTYPPPVYVPTRQGAHRSKIVQQFQAGIVQSILVNHGDHVQVGQVLIVLDPTAAKADALRIAQNLTEAELGRSRLEGRRAILGTAKPPVLIDLPTGATAEAIAAANVQMHAQALEEADKIADLDQQIAEKQFEVQQEIATITNGDD